MAGAARAGVGVDAGAERAPGTYEAEQSVEVTAAPIEARIHYTTNGADPAEADPWVSSGGVVLVSESQTLKVRAYLRDFYRARGVGALHDRRDGDG